MTEMTTAHSASSGIHRRARHPLTAVAVSVATGAVLLVLGLVMKANPADLPVVVALNQHHTGLVGTLTSGIYKALEPVYAVVLVAVLAAAVWAVSRSFKTAIAFGAVVGLTWLPSAILKYVVERPRPELSALSHPYSPWQTDASFPSGHTAFIVALTVTFCFLLRGTRWVPLVAALGTVATVVVGLAVMVNGLHYPTDVLASILWSLAMAPTARWIVVDLILARFGAKGRRRAAA
ncbi:MULTISPECIES: phosphatase PAP2 family protein [Arthrobacter]|uniref:Phosphatase PAP2 family protein n=2 Tax=Arthrobacter TaxID=1663 RepID=A0ABU9KNZ9_9MICC|nr:phosphatase PAP2 family protein [Arthrobacter sp. YJM1]MDP5228672.1 phosphatase PAP2 family protein [Arthrobacter sp. YJM1]